jgi:hypothetical protein
VDDRRIALVARLGRLNPTAILVATVAIVFGILLLPGPIGAVLLLGTAVALAALLTVTWRYHPIRARLFRLAVLAMLAILAIIRLYR